MSLDLIVHEENHCLIHQRPSDGYVNATALCKAAGKRLDRYWENQTTEEFIAELSRSPEFRGAEPVQAIVGGPPKLQGTWVHPQVAIHLAQWLSAEFAVKVSRWVFEWMSGQQPRGRPQPSLPGFIRRYLLNRDRVPDGHFSALEETMLNFVAPLEELGITIPDHLLPDGSQGRGFCAYLRHIHGIDTTLLPTYPHQFNDGRVVRPKAYPETLLPIYRQYVREEWKPKKLVPYLKDRVPKALEVVDQLPQLAKATQPAKLQITVTCNDEGIA